MADSKIEWTEQTWNPIVGCSIVSPGCTNCYAMKMASRIIAMAGNTKTGLYYDKTVKDVKGHPVWTGVINLAPDHTLFAPLHRKKPTTYFVNSMGDLFHEDCKDEWIDRVFAIMALCPQHTFQVLTKRAGRMLKYFVGTERYRDVHPMEDRVARIATAGGQMMEDGDNTHDYLLNADWPLPNVWLGVSTERQQEADERIPPLLQTPAAVHFISAEPLLGPIDLTRVRAPIDPEAPEEEWLFDALRTGDYYERRFTNAFGEDRFDSGDGPYRETKLDWVIVGGESGPDARPMHAEWARELRKQCDNAEVPFFFKQWGEWLPWQDFTIAGIEDDAEQTRFLTQEWCGDHWARVGYPMWCDSTDGNIDDEQCVGRVGKRAAGRLLDGIEHNAMPG